MKKVEKYICNFHCYCRAANPEELNRILQKHQSPVLDSEYNSIIQEMILSYLSIYQDISQYICGDEIDYGLQCEHCRFG